MKAKLRSACRALIPEGGIVTCAVSGGSDSVALLHAMTQLAPELHLEVRAAHFNHGLRGAESDRDEAFVRQLCADWGVALTVGRGDVSAQVNGTDDSVEEAARRLRYAFFDTLPGFVATAHTANDNLETLLINLIRGTSLAGLCGIPPRRGMLIRPMLEITRAEVEEYLSANGLLHVEDFTNASDAHLRNRVRQRLVPPLLEEAPALLRQTAALTARLRADEALLQSMAAEALEAARTQDGVCCPDLAALPEPLLHRVCLTLLDGIPDRTARHVEALSALIRSSDPSAQLDLPGGRIARREYELLRFDPPAPRPIPETALNIPGQTQAGRWRIICTLSAQPEGSCSLPYCPDKIYTVRSRRTGDTLRLPGGTKTVKKLLIDRKIPAAMRDSLPVICIGGAPAALPGIAAAVLPPAEQYLNISCKEANA